MQKLFSKVAFRLNFFIDLINYLSNRKLVGSWQLAVGNWQSAIGNW